MSIRLVFGCSKIVGWIVVVFFLPKGTYQFYNLTLFGLIFFASQFPSSHCQFPTVITIDRYYKISYHINLQYKAKVTTRKCFVVILSVWFFSTTFATKRTKCLQLLKCTHSNNLFYILFAFIFAFSPPCVIVISTYVPIFISAYQR